MLRRSLYVLVPLGVAGAGWAGYEVYQRPSPVPASARKKLVVVGSGWGAVSLLKSTLLVLTPLSA